MLTQNTETLVDLCSLLVFRNLRRNYLVGKDSESRNKCQYYKLYNLTKLIQLLISGTLTFKDLRSCFYRNDVHVN